MFSRLDDELLDHHKILAAGEHLGRNGAAIALGIYAVGLMWANRHLSDGHLPAAVVKNFSYADNPLAVAAALVRAGLWEKNGSGFVIHDFADHNLSAVQVKAFRKTARERQRRYRARRDA